MKKVMTCLFTLTLFLPALAGDRSARGRDCTTERFSRIITVELASPCTDEFISVTLNSRVSIKQCLNEDGQTITTVHVQSHGTAIGLDSGNEYVIIEQARNFSITTPGCGLSGTFLSRLDLISKGPQPNQKALLRSTLTLDSQCNTHMEDELEFDCHGGT